MINDIYSKIATRKDQVTNLLKRYKIKMAPGKEAIEIGYRKYGNRFALDLAQILQEAPAVKTDGGFMASSSNLAASPSPGTTNGTGTGTDGNIWSFLTGLFGTAGDAYSDYLDQKYGGIIANPSGNQLPAQSGGLNQTTLIMVGLGVVVFILMLVLILKK